MNVYMNSFRQWLWVVCLVACVVACLPNKAFAYNLNPDDYKKARQCNLTSVVDARTKTDAAYQAYLTSLGVPYTVKANGMTFAANKDTARNYCVLSYGGPSDVEPVTGMEQGFTDGQYEYLGFVIVDGKNVPVPNERFHDVCIGVNGNNICDHYVSTKAFLGLPWSANYDFIMNNKTSDAPPPNRPFYPYTDRNGVSHGAYGDDYAQFIKYPIDPFNGTDDDPNGDFDVYNANTQVNFLQGFPITNLLNFASAIVPPHEYTAGLFQMYQTVSSGTVWHRTFVIPPSECFLVCSAGNVNVGAGLDNATIYDDEELSGYIDIGNNHFGSVAAPCPTTSTTDPVCAGDGYNNGVITITDRATGKVAMTKQFAYWGIPYGYVFVRDIELSNLHIKLPKGDYYMRIDIPHYKGEDAGGIPPYADNAYGLNFTVKSRENAKLTMTGTTEYTAGEPLDFKFTVTNNMDSVINGNLAINVYEQTASGDKLAWSKTVPYSNIAVDGTYVYDMKPLNVQLPAGNYRVEGDITHYPTESRADGGDPYLDNHAEKDFKVRMYLPKYVRCKSLDVDYTKVIGVSGQNITRMCVGQTPEFPSTELENGQDTYFYVGYRLFPMPVPAYKVENLDKTGLDQKLTLQEPANKLGDCDPKTTDTSCRLTDTFLHFPTDTNPKGLTGPYTLGAPPEYHYTYRGRMFPDKVRFQFDILDPSGKKITASGNVVYDVSSDCYDTDALDIKDECRAIDFYIPKAVSDGKGTESAPYVVPYDKGSTNVPSTGSTFKNPGLHTFDLKVAEEQVYRYQKDNGSGSGTTWNYAWSNVLQYGKLN